LLVNTDPQLKAAASPLMLVVRLPLRSTVRFRVTSVTSAEIGELVNDVTVKLEDWLNAALADGEFGNGLDQFTFFVVSAFEERDTNELWAEARNKLGSIKDPVSGKSVRILSIAVAIPPVDMMGLSLAGAMQLVCTLLRAKVAVRPKRVPRGFEYERCAAAISAALSPYVTA
jgi:hypothetical protein